MLILTKNENYVEVTGDPSSLSSARKLILPEYTIINEKYKFIQRNLWSNQRKLTNISEQIEDVQQDIILLKKNVSKNKLDIESKRDKINELLEEKRKYAQKIDNISKYLKYNEEEITFYKVNKDTNIDKFEIGFLRNIKTILTKNNITFKIVNKSKTNSPKLKANRKLFNRFYQYVAVKKTLIYKRGIIKLPTGSGKTEIARQFTNVIFPYYNKKNKKIIFIVEQQDLLFQTRNTFKFDFPVSIGLVGDGIVQHEADIIIATVQTLLSLYKDDKEYFRKWAKSFGAYIVDECDMFVTDKRQTILRQFSKVDYRLFLSATPFSRFKKIEQMKLIGISGDIIYTVEEKDLQEQGFLSKQKSFFIKSFNPDNNKYIAPRNRWINTYKELIVDGKHRNKLINQIYEILKELNLRSLFIVENLEHGENLQKLMKVPFISGKHDRDIRQHTIKDINNGKNPIVITTRIFRRAINIVNLQVIVNCAGYKSDNIVMQTKGRTTRLKTSSSNKGIYIDLFDYGNEILEKHSEERMHTIELNNIENDLIYLEKLKQEILNYLK